MALQRYRRTLQEPISSTDSQWVYSVPDLPAAARCNQAGLVKSLALISNTTTQEISLRLTGIPSNRAISGEPLDHFVHVTLSDFRLQPSDPHNPQPVTTRESADYVARFLKAGLIINGVRYSFYGHSNSQLKSRSCFLLAGSKDEVGRKVEGLGDFSKITSVAKKAKRIGLLFSTAHSVMEVAPERCRDIADVENENYIFTDGCGLIALGLARLLVRKRPIVFRNHRYLPAVFQIRYRGYKGVVTLEPQMQAGIWLELRKSMRKFTGTSDLKFAVVEYSKPYTYGYLNDEIVLLLHSLGVSTEILLQKQREHLQFLEQARTVPAFAFRFLNSLGQNDLAEKLLMQGADSIKKSLDSLIGHEYGKMLTKRNDQRCRVLVPKSRLLFGVCDPRDILKSGECFVRVTNDGDGIARTIVGTSVLVARNPCLHRGDLQKLKTVDRRELHHLVDCMVFSTKGRRPAADMMSGGDLDGDTFFVCWDSDLVPTTVAEPAEYPGAREPLKFAAIRDDDRIEYFARSASTQLGRVKNLFLEWARHSGPMSGPCQELNRLFSQCVDANRIEIPKRLLNLPPPHPSAEPFILDILHSEAISHIKRIQPVYSLFDESPRETLEKVLCDSNPLSQFELAKLTLRWCQSHNTAFEEFWAFFDPTTFSAEERTWLLSQLPPKRETASLVMNDLLHSDILSTSELRTFRLDYQGIRWRCVFASATDRLANLMERIQRTFDTFTRKLLVLQISDRLSVAIYVPRRIEKEDECAIDSSVRLFAFPHTHHDRGGHRRVVPTKVNYRFFYDQGSFQLYERQRSNTFIYLVRSANDDSKYRNSKGTGNKARLREETIQDGVNSEWKVSIALNKFSDEIATQIGRVNRASISNAELYVISESDTRSLRTLDLWLEQVDTAETHSNFDKVLPEFKVPQVTDVDWSLQTDIVRNVARDKILESLDDPTAPVHISSLLQFTWANNAYDVATELYRYLLPMPANTLSRSYNVRLFKQLIDFLAFMPSLVIYFARISPWNTLPESARQILVESVPKLLKALIMSANSMGGLVVKYLRAVFEEADILTLTMIQDLTEMVALVVSSPEVALDVFLEGLEPLSTRLTVQPPRKTQYLLRNLFGIALDHLDESNESSKTGKYPWKFEVQRDDHGEVTLLTCQRRIDAPQLERLATGDHVRFLSASEPVNAFLAKPAMFEAMVESAQTGEVKFRCLRQPPVFVEDCFWKLKHCGSFVTAKAMSDAVVRLLVEKDECCGVFSRLTISAPSDISIEPTAIPQKDRNNLNPSQSQAVSAALRGPLACLWGPPGTGKTYTIVTFLRELLRSEPAERVLVTAPTHNAVDNVMRQLLKRQGEGSTQLPLPLRVSTDAYKVADDLKSYTCDAMVGKNINQFPAARRKAQRQISESRLIFTTCVGAGLGLLRNESFGTIVIDEASQQTEPASLIPLVKGCQRAVLVGDHVQLRATVHPHAQLQGLDVSLFERLWTSEENSQQIHKVMLNVQYRMHPSLCTFPSSEFYDDKLLTGETCHTIPLPESLFPWPEASNQTQATKARCVFIQCSHPEDLGQKSKSNEGQAKLCQEVLRRLTSPPSPPPPPPPPHTSPTPSITILTPYTRQATLLRRLCPHSSTAAAVVVSSIDGFQGQEADIIIYVTVRCNVHAEIGFLKDLRRMNVALTRARAGVIVVGDRATLTGKMGEEGEESCRVWDRWVRGAEVVEMEVVC